jgi:porphobilinogen deaminase
VNAEKSLMSFLGGGCHSCIGAHLDGNRFLVFHEDTRHYTFEVSTADKTEIQAIAGQLKAHDGN